jgi:hypothetical protein
MTFANRLVLFAAITVAGFVAWQWNAAIDSARDLTPLAVAQLHDPAAAAQLREASWAQNWWPFVWPGLLGVIGAVLFWDDVARCWHKDGAQ